HVGFFRKSFDRQSLRRVRRLDQAVDVDALQPRARRSREREAQDKLCALLLDAQFVNFERRAWDRRQRVADFDAMGQEDGETEGQRDGETEGRRDEETLFLLVSPSLRLSVPLSLHPSVSPSLRLSVPLSLLTKCIC